jgi:hypothetical protein
MNRQDQEMALRWTFREEHVAITGHARFEMGVRGITTDDVMNAGRTAEVIEEDRDRPQGTTKVLLGANSTEDAIHLVVNVEQFEADPRRRIRLVTTYRPEWSEWRDERTRG